MNLILPQGLCTACPLCPAVSLQGLSALGFQATCSESLLAQTGEHVSGCPFYMPRLKSELSHKKVWGSCPEHSW